ncbi:MAG TPA: hypothetical protein VHU40_22840 [Polyangia bacterium]|jgi:hypothetical protein|nr:hypothetical protein [Polyangia bacterium]
MLPDDLEDWLTEEGDRVVQKVAAAGAASLNRRERLVYEIWLFDTEQRNGGVSQYFANWGREHWDTLCAVAIPLLPRFSAFAACVHEVVAEAADAYLAVLESDGALDRAYEECRASLVSDLRRAVSAV